MPTVLVTGAGRGLGREFARQYAADGWSVIATVRNPEAADPLRSLGGDIRIELLDMRDRPGLAAFARRLAAAPLDLFIANAGISGPGRLKSAEDAAGWMEAFGVNVVAPALLGEMLAPSVIAARGKMVAITSRRGSITEISAGGWNAYRASKAALNAAWRAMAAELSSEPISIAMIHPGTAKTDMAGAAAPLEIADSISAVRRVIEGLTPEEKGVFLDYRGETLPW